MKSTTYETSPLGLVTKNAICIYALVCCFKVITFILEFELLKKKDNFFPTHITSLKRRAFRVCRGGMLSHSISAIRRVLTIEKREGRIQFFFFSLQKKVI